MAADYTVESSSGDIQVLSPTVVQDVTRFGIRTKPSDVLVYVNVPVERVTALQAATTLEGYALLVETAMRTPGVVAMRPEQDTDGSGLLADYMVVTVEVAGDDPSSGLPVQTEVRILTRYFAVAAGYAKGVGEPIGKAIAGLQAAL